MKRLLYCLFIALMVLSCKEDDEVDFSDIPTLTVVGVSPASVKQFNEPIVLTLAYEDQNGDLGSEDPDEKVLWVKDSRLTEADLYHVKPLAPIGANVPIQGTLEVEIRSAFLLGNGDSEQVSFTVKIEDRAGNWSEEDTSPPVTITK